MNRWKLHFYDGTTEIVEAEKYRAEGRVCVFYEGTTARRIVPLYMLERIEKVS